MGEARVALRELAVLLNRLLTPKTVSSGPGVTKITRLINEQNRHLKYVLHKRLHEFNLKNKFGFFMSPKI